MSSRTAADDTELAAGAAGLRDRVVAVAYCRPSGFVTPHSLMLSNQVARMAFSLLTFVREGYFNPASFHAQQRARAEVALAPVFGSLERSDGVVDSAARFIDQGGRWTPSARALRLLERAALGRVTCQRL